MPFRPPYTVYNLIDHLNVPQLLRFNAFARNHVDITTDDILVHWVTHDPDGPRVHEELVKMHIKPLVNMAEEYDADDKEDMKWRSSSKDDNEHDENDDTPQANVKEPAERTIVRTSDQQQQGEQEDQGLGDLDRGLEHVVTGPEGSESIYMSGLIRKGKRQHSYQMETARAATHITKGENVGVW